MRRNWKLTWAIATIGAILSLPAMAASPFGSFGGIVGGGNAGSGVIPIHGWALHDVGVAAVDVYVDGVIAGRANLGKASPGVAELYPGYPNNSLARWGFRLNTTVYPNDLHAVSILVTAVTGETASLPVLYFEFLNSTHDLVPFGEIELPLEDTELFGTCDDPGGLRRLSVVSGYAVDTGLTPEDTGVKWVQLLLNGAIIFDSQTDCDYIPEMGGLTNCYGLIHRASEEWYPTLVDPPHAGYRFVLDVGHLVDIGHAQGHHVLTVRAGDLGSQQENIDNVRVSFLCDDRIGNDGSFGDVGLPADGALYSDTVSFTGWALDWEGLWHLDIYVDGEYAGTTFPVEGRPLISAAYPGFPDSLTPGWSFPFDTTGIENGAHSFWVDAIDIFGFHTTLAERTFWVANP